MSETDLKPRVAGLIKFMIDQLELAKNPNDQLGAVAAASGAIPCLITWLGEDQTLLLNLVMLFHITDQKDWQENWVQKSKEPSAIFAPWAEDTIDRLKAFGQLLTQSG